MAFRKAGLLLALAAIAMAKPSWQPGPFFLPRGSADYVVKAPGWAAEFHNAEVLLTHQGSAITVRFLGANADVAPQPRRRLHGRANLFLGNDPRAWRRGVSIYRAIAYHQLYPGIDLVYSGLAGHLKSEFRLSPGADTGVIQVHYAGIRNLRVDDTGALLAETAKGVFREEAPVAYQESAGRKLAVPAAFRILGDGRVGFQTAEYDRTQPLVIDPAIGSSTYLGGSGIDAATSVAVDNAGNVYVAGWTDSTDLPAVNAFRARGGGVDAFVAKWGGSGSSLIYCTYLGGSGNDQAFGIAVDSAGNAYVTGTTSSANFPLMSPRQGVLGGAGNAFVAKLNATGSLVYSTYLGGAGSDSGNAIAVDSAGNVTVAGDTTSNNFPLQAAYQSCRRGQTDVFVTRLNAAGNGLIYSTYLGGSGDDHGRAVALDSAGAAYITGSTTSRDFPVLSAFQTTSGGGQDAFVAKLSSAGNTLIYSTYLGGSGGATGAPEIGSGIAVDASGNAYVTGATSSNNFPVLNALQPSLGGQTDAFLSKLNPAGNGLIYSTYLGGSSLDYGMAVTVDAAGNAWVAGYTASSDFPTNAPVQPNNAGKYDAFVAALNPAGTALIQSTYLGGADNDSANAIAVDRGGNVYVAGQTLSSDFPIQNATQPVNAGSIDAFLLRLAPPPQYSGALQTAACAAITGWAWDASNPNNSVNVDILDGATVIATVPANLFQSNLLSQGMGNGNHGFSYAPPASIKDGQAHMISARISQTSTNLSSSPQSLTCTTAFAGYHDSATCGSISGWAWDPANPNTPLNIDILDGANLLATVPANVFRPDLQKAGMGNGNHGFVFATPISLEDGRPHTIMARISQTSVVLRGSPKSLTCQSPGGSFDTASCSAIAGWAWDPNNPNTPVSVNILDGANLLATVPANVFRPDLKKAGMGNGYYGFSFSTPPALGDGQAHSLKATVAGTAIVVGTRSLTCTGLAGVLDAATCGTISGWAWNQYSPNTAVSVDILDGASLLATVTANVFRQDLFNANMGNGNHSFSYATPASLLDGRTHSIQVQFSGGTVALAGSPKPLQCSSP